MKPRKTRTTQKLKDTEPARPSRRVRLLAGVLVIAGILAYWNSLSGPFIYDDHLSIVENEQIRTLWSPSVLMPERELPVAGRPLVNISFALNYALGGLNVRGYHIGNLAVHLLCGLLVFAVVRRTLLIVGSGRP